MKAEAKIERAVCLWAKSQGILSFKFTSPAHRGVPDRIFFHKGKTALIEFKAPEGKLSALQEDVIAQLREQGATVGVFRETEAAKSWLKLFLL